jgi:hypothetical protein
MNLWQRWTLIGTLWGLVSLLAFLIAKSSGTVLGIPHIIILVIALPTAIVLVTFYTFFAPLFAPLVSLLGAFVLLIPIVVRAVLGGVTGYLFTRYRRAKK